MADHNPITKITSKGESFDIGANFENVFLNDSNDFSLANFYEHYSNFLNSNMFMLYSEKEPAAANVKIWYQTYSNETD